MDKNKMLKILEKGLLRLEDIKNIEDNKEIILKYIELYYKKYSLYSILECDLEKYFDKKLLEDEEFINKSFKYIPALLSRASEKIKNSDEVKELIKEDIIYFQYAGKKIKNDKEFILSLIKKDIEYKKNEKDFIYFKTFFNFISDELKNDGEFILEILKLAGDLAKYEIRWSSNDNGYNSITIKDVGENALKYRDLILYPYSFLKPCDRVRYLEKCTEAHKKLVEFYKNDKEVQFALIKKDDSFNEDFAKNYDKKTIIEMLETTKGKGYRTIPDEMKKDREITSKAITLNCYNFIWAPAIYKDDREFVLKAVMCDGEMLEGASMELRDDEEIAMIAYHRSNGKLTYISDRLKRNKKFREKLETSTTWALDYKTPEERDNKEIVLEAVKINGRALKLASDRLKKDKDIIIEASKNDISALEFVDKDLITKELILEILSAYNSRIREIKKDNFKYFEQFKDDKEIIKTLYSKIKFLTNFSEWLKEVNSKLLLEKEFLFSLEENCYYILDFAHEKLKEDKEFLLEIGAKIGELNLNKISDKLKKDKNFIMELLDKKIEFDYFDLDESLQKDKEIVLKYLEYIDSTSSYDDIIGNFPNDKEIVLKVIEKDEEILKEIDDSLKKDKEFMLEAIKVNPLSFQFSKTKAKPVALEAFKQNFINYKYFTAALKKDVKSFIKILKERIEEKRFIDLDEIEGFDFQLAPEITDNDEAVITYFKVCKKEVIEKDEYFFDKVPEKWQEIEWKVKLIES